MAFKFKYQNKDLFYYHSNNEDLTCPYCERLFDINSSKLKSLITQCISAKQYDLPYLFMRCIFCDLYSEDYPFKIEYKDGQFQPNSEQKSIIEELYQQILLTTQNNYVNNLFLIEGYAGTGKTSVVTHLLKYPEFSAFKVCFSAPTNKALNVLMDKLNDKKDDNEYVELEALGNCDEKDWIFKTVFKLLNNKMVINPQGETLFDFKQSETLKSKYDIIIIDEVSMVEKQQLEHILNLMESLKKERHLGGIIPVVIFLGDVGQLPPVGEDSSIIFEKDIQSKYQIKRLQLTEIMRSQDRITELSLKVRDLIPMKIEEKIKKDLHGVDLKTFNGKQINYFNDRSQWIANYAEVFKKNLTVKTKNKSNTAPIILVYTNPECDALNISCRDLIFNSPKEKYVKGELLVFNNYYCISRQKKLAPQSQKTEPYFLKFYTSEPIIVSDVQSSTITITDFQFAFIFKSVSQLTEKICRKITETKMQKHKKEYFVTEITNLLSKWSIDSKDNTIITHDSILDKQLNKLSSIINQMKHTYDIYQLNIDGSHKLDPLDDNQDTCQILVIKENSMDKYLNTCNEIKSKIKSYYDYLNNTYKNNPLMRILTDNLFQMIWLQYYYGKYIWPFADIVYGYAITTHKSQGSTYENIYVNIPNILGCQKVNNLVKSKSLYTAMTRASHYVNVYHHKQFLWPLIPLNKIFKCHICGSSNEGNAFPTVNCTIEKKCADKILTQIKATTLYKYNDINVILSDKNKNLYVIPIDHISDIHINDAYDYVNMNNLIRTETEKYLYSNIILAIDLLKLKH